MLRTLLCDERNQFRVVEDPSAISDIVRSPRRVLWLDLEQPTLAEFRMIEEEFNLHPLAIEDAMARHQRPKVDQYESFYLVVFYSVALEESGTGAGERVPGRRGLRGSSFLRRSGNGHTEYDSLVSLRSMPDTGAGEPDGQALSIVEEVGADERIVLRELTMFMGPNYLITVHTYPVPELDEAARRWRRNLEIFYSPETDDDKDRVPGTRPLTSEERGLTVFGPKPAPPEAGAAQSGAGKAPSGDGREVQVPAGMGAGNIGVLLYSLLDTLVDNYFPVIDTIVEQVEAIEEQVFRRYNQQAIEAIFTLKKELLTLRRVLAPERDVLNVLTRRDVPIFEAHTLVYLQDVYDHVVRITESIDSYRDLLSSALDSYLSMQSNRLNVTVQTLTSFSIILMSVAAVTGWYGMNFEYMPELHSPLAYPVVIVVVIIIVVAEAIFFRRKGWL